VTAEVTGRRGGSVKVQRPSSQLQEFARIGAAARIKELQAEIASIRRHFPALTAPTGERAMPSPFRKRPGRPAASPAAEVLPPEETPPEDVRCGSEEDQRGSEETLSGSEVEEVTRPIAAGHLCGSYRIPRRTRPGGTSIIILSVFRRMGP
jgi:hypothetical protein